MALVVAPTRELAMQVQRELDWLYASAGGRVVACVGGMDPRRERRQLESGAHLVVGTPGRLKDHIERGALQLGEVRAVVLDEADEMLDLGFREDLEFILEATPAERRTLLFSATLPKAIVALATKYQRDAHRIAATDGERGHADIEYRAVRTQPREVEHAIVNLLRQLDSPASIIFCNTRDAVRHLQATLTERGFSAVYLSGELGQNERNQALQALRDGRARICVATDVAARGIDLPNLNLVIHADLPLNAEILQHRSGRTGRAGRKGISVLVVPHSRRRKAERLIAEARLKPQWMDPPTADEIRLLDRERFLADPQFDEELTEEDRALGEILLARKTPPTSPRCSRGATGSGCRPRRSFRSRSRCIRRAATGTTSATAASQSAPAASARIFHATSVPVAARELRSRAGSPERRAGPRGFPHGCRRRRQKADPKWLLPMICRRGNVNRKEIGTIRIFEETTEFEVSRAAAEHFALHARQKDETTSASCPRARPAPSAMRVRSALPVSTADAAPDRAPREDKPRWRKKGMDRPDRDDAPRPAAASRQEWAERPEKKAFEKKPSERRPSVRTRPTGSRRRQALREECQTKRPIRFRQPQEVAD